MTTSSQRTLSALIIFAGVTFGQTPALTVPEFQGFKHIFFSLGKPDLTIVDSERRLTNYALQLGLIDSETSALRSAASDFRQTLSGFQEPLTQQVAAQQTQIRDARIIALASSFLQQLSAAKQLRILAHFDDPSKVDTSASSNTQP
jgi:hypothetical protein